jgi:hypothetical protein
MIGRLIEMYMSHVVAKIHYTDQKMVFVNLLIDNIYATSKNTEALIDANKKVGLEVNAQKVKNMLKSYVSTRVSSPECRAKS